MTRFKFWPSIRKSYDEQGTIFFTCRRYGQLSKAERGKIDALIYRAGGEYANALRDLLLTDTGWGEVCQRWYVSDNTLRRCVRRFYNLW